ncbi:ABC transporter ATP-binding protein/permease [Mesorhizobium sp. M0955]|uniref:ABC transporter ATP-binding protein n=1 Tax=Mesorhizobium sp. M0955 TaxID=2957033 RepID=UPI00333AFD74
MARFRIDLRAGAFRSVLGFTLSHWRRQPWRLAGIMGTFLLSTLADVLTPLYSGRLVDAVASSAAADDVAWNAAMAAFSMLVALALTGVVLRNLAFMAIVELTLKMMADIAADAFHRVQRFSTDWHANSFAGSTVRKITRGMWALDLLNDTILIALLPSVVMLVGSTLLLGWFWPLMGAVVAIGSVLFIAVTTMLSLGYVAPAARLANAWDTRLGGSLADAVSCNAVVKGFGAEEREETRLAEVVAKWRGRTRRTWMRGTVNGTTQGTMLLLLRAAVIGFSLLLWSWGQASAGDVAFVLTSFFVLQGYLRDIGTHIRNLQRSINDMEELVDFQSEPLGIEDRPGAKPIRITDGRITFDKVTFHYGSHRLPLYRYDVTAGNILIDGQDIAKVAQASLRAQIAIVQQEPILFHRSLAENIAYARPAATQAEIEHAARLASAHDFIANLPKGYGTLVGERGVKLSGGERQRVAIARAFLADARILILDEATSSLDSESEVLIQQAMERLMVGRTTLVIAHRLSTVRALDRLLVFDRGRIVEEGSHDQLIRLQGGIYRRLFERQALELTKGLVI